MNENEHLMFQFDADLINTLQPNNRFTKKIKNDVF